MTRVLVVDDEIDTLNLLRMILEISGFEAVTTLNSVDALTLAEVEHPDCVLLDIMMPKLDGFTLCKMMRLHPATSHLPIVFVTAYSALDLEDRRKEAGADMVLPKPVGMDILLETIGKATTLRAPKPVVLELPKVAELPKAVELLKPAELPKAAELPKVAEPSAAPKISPATPTVTPEPQKGSSKP